MIIFYMQTFPWSSIEKHFLNTDIDVICIDLEKHYDYDYYLTFFTGRKCIHLYPMSSNSNEKKILTIGMPMIDTYGDLTKLRMEIVREIGDEKDIVIIFEYQIKTYRNEEPCAFYRFFLDLRKELSFNLHIILSMYEKLENDNYKQFLRMIPEIDKVSSACIFNQHQYLSSDADKPADEWHERMQACDELFCDELNNVIAALTKTDDSGFYLYNHKTHNYESFNAPTEFHSDFNMSLSFFESIAPINDRTTCALLKNYRNAFSNKYGKKKCSAEKPCEFNGVCHGSCEYCERISELLWDYSKKTKESSQDNVMSQINGIERLRIDVDGKGVRSLVLMGGCPLNCKYCGNRKYKDVFPCSMNANAERLYDMVKKDCIYFEMSGGGLTFGGGEPLLHAKFIHNFHTLYPMLDINIETCLNAENTAVEMLVGDVSEWIIDVKDMNSDIYTEYTSCGNELVIKNLKFLTMNVPADRLHIRVPKIEGFNTEKDIASSVKMLNNIGFTNIEVFDYVVI